MVKEYVAVLLERDRLLGEREDTEADLQRLRLANQALHELIGIAGHELKTPLTVIKASVQRGRHWLNAAMAGGKIDFDRHDQALLRMRDLVAQVDRQIGAMERLVADLQDVTRLRTSAQEPRLEPCDLGAIVSEVVEDQRLVWPTRRILFDGPDEAMAVVLAEPQRIGQVVTNYVTNALRYSPGDKPVRVRLELVGGEARVSVRDEGAGLPLGDHHRIWGIWERFQPARRIKQHAGSRAGLGLGLYLCRTIIEQHNGHVGVESTPGRGSTFWCALPLFTMPFLARRE